MNTLFARRWPSPIALAFCGMVCNMLLGCAARPSATTLEPHRPLRMVDVSKLVMPSRCITAVTQDSAGRWWFGTEGQGVFCYSPAAHGLGEWGHFTRRNGAPRNVYALSCDALGRIWAGSLGHGVCVYNGRYWRNYDLLAGRRYGTAAGDSVEAFLATAQPRRLLAYKPAPGNISRAGPLGQRVFAIATSPVDGSVWMATSKGLTRYHIRAQTWQYYTTANGLPVDTLSCLAFAPNGTLFIGTQCNGIAWASPQSHYRLWHRIVGPVHLPLTAMGLGLPSNLINALLVVPRKKVHGRWRYRVYAGTDGGLAIGNEDGRRWRFIRGRNYLGKIKGLWHVPTHYPQPSSRELHGLLTSDFVTCLAMDGDGNIWIGHRSTGLEVWNQNQHRIFPTARSPDSTIATGFVASLAPLVGSGMLIGGYECGAFHAAERWSAMRPGRSPWQSTTTPPLPAGALPPSQAELARWIARVTAGQGHAVTAAFMDEDWRTEGDWVGHYGVRYARLCAGTPQYANAEEQFFGGLGGADIIRESSPHQYAGDVAYYVSWYHSALRRTLYFPDANQRIEAEWNDAGGRYPRLYDGPDMWLKVKVPTGLYRLSFYFHNKDGQTGGNDRRDYVVGIYPKHSSPALAWACQRPLAQARIMQFWGGMYCSFVLKGPGNYQVRLKRNYGYWMTVAGMFLDRVSGPRNLTGFTNLDGLPMKDYRPPQYKPTPSVAASPAWKLWHLLNHRASYSKKDMGAQWPGRVLAYRYAQFHGFPPAMLARWRWKLNVWLPVDRAAFNRAMATLADQP